MSQVSETTNKDHSNRLWEMDLVRGLMVLLMTAGHVVHFSHNFSNPLLNLINTTANILCFTIFLLVSGAIGYVSYIHNQDPTWKIIRRVGTRLFIYLFGYYLLSLFIIVSQNGWQQVSWPWMLETAYNVVTLQQFPPFAEFIVSFIIFGLLQIPLRPLLRKVAQSWVWVTVFSLVSFQFALIAYNLELAWMPVGWKALLVGEPGWYTFPILFYTPVYLIGLWIGARRYHHQAIYKPLHWLSVSGLVSLIIVFALSYFYGYNPDQLMNRWPPSIPYLLIGLSIGWYSILLFKKLNNLQHHPWTRTLLLLLGQNAYAIFLTHTFQLFAYNNWQLPASSSLSYISALWIISLLISLYLSKVLPLNFKLDLTLIKWCECKVYECRHSKESKLKRTIKFYLWSIINLPRLLSIEYKGHRYPLLHSKHVITALALLLLSATALGVAENYHMIRDEVSATQGRLSRNWIIIDQLESTRLEYRVNLPSELSQSEVLAVLDNGQQIPMIQEQNDWYIFIPISALDPGVYQVSAIVRAYNTSFELQPSEFTISYPLYVTWTIDWEGADVPDHYLQAITDLADDYGIPLTHMFNPRIFTTETDIKPRRANYLTEWVKLRRDLHNDEIGLHLHMFPDFVEAAGVEAKTEPIWDGGWLQGYDILTTVYTREEMRSILNYAKQLFVEKGLGEPLSYRAGAWFANEETLKALADTGFLIDSSGRTAYKFGKKQVSGEWSLQNNTQPYYPCPDDQNSSNCPRPLNILEIPNNGGDTFAFSKEQMITKFDDNFDGQPLLEPRQVTFLSHPEWFNQERQEKMKQVLEHVNQWHNRNDAGPVVFATLQQVYEVFQ